MLLMVERSVPIGLNLNEICPVVVPQVVAGLVIIDLAGSRHDWLRGRRHYQRAINAKLAINAQRFAVECDGAGAV